MEQATVLRGLLGFAIRLILGRALKWPLRILNTASTWKDSNSKISSFCDRTITCAQRLRPRYISVLANSVPVIVYTNGAFESGHAAWDAVVVDHYDSWAIARHTVIPNKILER